MKYYTHITKALFWIAISFTHAVGATTDTWNTNGNGTVTDVATALMWQQQDDSVRRNFQDANAYCDDLVLADYRDWRLPNIKELATIVDHRTHTPALDLTAFIFDDDVDIFDDVEYWSTTTRANNISQTGRPMIIEFVSGNIDTGFTSQDHYVLCVRSYS